MTSGQLWVVATPIGNLDDLSARAEQVLSHVDLIAAEDTRRTRKLLHHLGIAAELCSLHEHNEAGRVAGLIERLRKGDTVALVSDAGTPLISDPGYRLVRRAREAGITVSPVPGPSAATAALSVAGLPTDRFHFEGFLPSKAGARKRRLEGLAPVEHTLVFYETPQRIIPALEAMAETFGADRRAAIARELTKRHETVWTDSLDTLTRRVRETPDQQRGEYVVVVAGCPHPTAPDERLAEGRRLFRLLRTELPPGRAAKLAARFSGCRRNDVYGGGRRETGDGRR